MDLLLFDKIRFIDAFDSGKQVEIQRQIRWEHITNRDMLLRLLDKGFPARYIDKELGNVVYLGFPDENGNTNGQTAIGTDVIESITKYEDIVLKRRELMKKEEVNAEVLMTFLQLCRDEWGKFLNCKTIKRSNKNYIKYQLRDNLSSIFRSIKNRFVQQGNESFFDVLMETIADHSDDVEEYVNELRGEIMSNIVQSMSYENQEPFSHALITYCFLYFSQIYLKKICGSNKYNYILLDSMKLIDKCPETYGWNAWKSMDNVVDSNMLIKIRDKIISFANAQEYAK